MDKRGRRLGVGCKNGYIFNLMMTFWASGVARGGVWGFNPPPIRIEAVFFHSRKVTASAIKHYNVSLTTRRTINSHNLHKTNHLGRVVRLLAW